MLVNFDSLKTVMNGIKTYIDGSNKTDWNESDQSSGQYIKNRPFYEQVIKSPILINSYDEYYPYSFWFVFQSEKDLETYPAPNYEFNKEYQIQIGPETFLENFYLYEVTEDMSYDSTSEWYNWEPGYYLMSNENYVETKIVIKLGEDLSNIPSEIYMGIFDLKAAQSIYSIFAQYNGGAYILDPTNTDESNPYVDMGVFFPYSEDYASIQGYNFIIDGKIFKLDEYDCVLVSKKEEDVFKLQIDNEIYTLEFEYSSFEEEAEVYALILDENKEEVGGFYIGYYEEEDEDGNYTGNYINYFDIVSSKISNDNVNIKLYVENYQLKKIDPKFNYPVDWDSPNINQGDFIKNKPFGEIYEEPQTFSFDMYLQSNPYEPYRYYGYFGSIDFDDGFPLSISNHPNTKVVITYDSKDYEFLPLEAEDVILYDTNYNPTEFGDVMYFGHYPSDTYSYAGMCPFSIFIPIDNPDTVFVKEISGDYQGDKYTKITINVKNCYEKKIDKKYLPKQVNADWNTRNIASDSYIKNKPFGKYEINSEQLEYNYLNSSNYNGSFSNDNGTPIHEYKYYYYSWQNELSLNPNIDYTFYFVNEDKKYTAAWKYDEEGGYYLGNDPNDFFIGNYSEDFPFFMFLNPDNNRYLIIYSYNCLHDLDSGDGPKVELYKNTLEIQTISQDYLPYKIEVVTELPEILNDDTFYVIPEETE